MTKADNSIRLGFTVDNLELTVQSLKSSNWEILSDIAETEWGSTAIVRDLDGRKIELKEK